MAFTLHSLKSARSERISTALSRSNHSNCFNPSILFLHDQTFISFRAFGSSGKLPFRGYLARTDGRELLHLVDLTHHAQQEGIGLVADPKLFQYQGDVWVTFNTGYSKQGNDVYIQQVTPELGRPLKCEFRGRSLIEKNWAFFERKGSLCALYSLAPLRVLQEVFHDESERRVVFECRSRDENETITAVPHNLTIGTQVSILEDQAFLIGHEKLYLGPWRTYLGRLVKLDLENDGIKTSVSRRRLVHSYRSLLGSRRKYNPRLLSCTYFSGLQIDGDSAIVSYGINDVDWAIRELKLELLWK